MDAEKHPPSEPPFESGSTTPLQHVSGRTPRSATSDDSIGSDATETEGGIPQKLPSLKSPKNIQYNTDLEKGPGGSQSENLQAAVQHVDSNLVDWDGPSDPENPMNWGLAKKWYITMMMSAMTFCITFSSSVFSQATAVTAKVYGVSTEVTTLATSFVVLGFALGPLVFGPLSELYGRPRPLFVGFIISAIFQIPVAVAQNIETILICRFFIGMFGSAAMAIVGGVLVDLWGPAAFVCSRYLKTSAHCYCSAALLVFLKETGNPALRTALDDARPTMQDIFSKYFSRPLKMLVLEPILLLITLYLAITYGILYLFFFAYPISFQEVRGWKHPGVAALPFIGLFIGILAGCMFVVYFTRTRFARKMREAGSVVPEERLPPMIAAAFILPAGLFWFSWTSSPTISWVPQVISGIPTGFGIIVIFLQGLNYLTDIYMMFTNSAFAANTLVRSGFGAAFPLFAAQMFHKLGVRWAGSLLGFLTVAMIPVPMLFYVYGNKIRAMSRFSPKL
ncbi:benomyl/methotrexate resistance protein [Coccidioides immitis RMSCC 3703]|uniref:Benomyl/methotrexate resistance protein n=1 Tax=Coccidioides immitis RMSCC 3703 TaxID=454286 RepID=A0A0J8TVR8_COCIT|nr:benomyl/methotrexate resistance protein [Coccidioides immitis RMSCC 3703]